MKKYIYVERENELLIDDDFHLFTENNAFYVLRAARVEITIIRIMNSGKPRHRHIFCVINQNLPTLARIALRAALGEDRTKTGFDIRNALLGSPSLLFSPFHKIVERKHDFIYSKEKVKELRKWQF